MKKRRTKMAELSTAELLHSLEVAPPEFDFADAERIAAEAFRGSRSG